MAAFKKILVPTDFSDVSRAALRCASELARAFGASLTILHVTDDLVAEALTAGVATPRSVVRQEHTEEQAKARLEDLRAEPQLDGLPVDCAVLAGSPIPEILGYAEQHAFDLIVMGTHGRRALSRVLLGSVAECVVRMSPCPVLTVRTSQQQFAAS